MAFQGRFWRHSMKSAKTSRSVRACSISVMTDNRIQIGFSFFTHYFCEIKKKRKKLVSSYFWGSQLALFSFWTKAKKKCKYIVNTASKTILRNLTAQGTEIDSVYKTTLRARRFRNGSTRRHRFFFSPFSVISFPYFFHGVPSRPGVNKGRRRPYITRPACLRTYTHSSLPDSRWQRVLVIPLSFSSRRDRSQRQP